VTSTARTTPPAGCTAAGVPARLAASFGGLYRFLLNKWYFDEIYNTTLVRGSAFLGNIFMKADKKIIDGIGPDGLARLAGMSSRGLSRMHTGYLYHYAFVIIGAAIVFGAILWLRSGGAR
jgi:NADH-quinone oxidoreductase subunit L